MREIISRYIKVPTIEAVASLGEDVTTINDEDLMVACYSRLAVLKGYGGETWSDTLRNVRGLVFKKGIPISKGIHKFFNVGEPNQPTYPVLNEGDLIYLFEKIDGAQVTMFHDGIQWRFHTKAGINHEFERWAKELFDKGLIHGMPANHIRDGEPLRSRVYNFEMIHPEDSHVIKYPPGLYLLSEQVFFVTGQDELSDFSVFPWAYPGEVRVVDSWKLAEQSQESAQHEGYVAHVVARNGGIVASVKLKSPTYMKMRKELLALESGLNKSEILRNFKLVCSPVGLAHPSTPLVLTNNDGLSVVIRYDSSVAIAAMGERFDDWISFRQREIESLEAILNEELHIALGWVSTIYESSRKDVARQLLKLSPHLLPLVMALYDGHSLESIERIINYKLLPMFIKEYEAGID